MDAATKVEYVKEITRRRGKAPPIYWETADRCTYSISQLVIILFEILVSGFGRNSLSFF